MYLSPYRNVSPVGVLFLLIIPREGRISQPVDYQKDTRDHQTNFCMPWKPGLVVGDPACSRGLKPDDHCGPFQPRPFCDSVIL